MTCNENGHVAEIQRLKDAVARYRSDCAIVGKQARQWETRYRCLATDADCVAAVDDLDSLNPTVWVAYGEGIWLRASVVLDVRYQRGESSVGIPDHEWLDVESIDWTLCPEDGEEIPISTRTIAGSALQLGGATRAQECEDAVKRAVGYEGVASSRQVRQWEEHRNLCDETDRQDWERRDEP